jgi:phage tail protein X
MATSSDTSSRTVITRQGDTLSRICWENYGSSSGIMEQVLAANPHLCPHSGSDPLLIFPAGLTITLPAITQAATASDSIQLWT